MKKFAILSLFAISLSGAAWAEGKPEIKLLTDAEMDNVVAGVGANNVAVQPWPALTAAGFTLKHLPSSDAGAAQAGSLDGVAVPSAVPHSQ